MRYIIILGLAIFGLTGCFAQKTNNAANVSGDGSSSKIQFDTNDNLDQALQDLDAVKE